MMMSEKVLPEYLLSQGVKGLYRGYRSTVLREVGETCCEATTSFFYFRMCAANHM